MKIYLIIGPDEDNKNIIWCICGNKETAEIECERCNILIREKSKWLCVEEIDFNKDSIIGIDD